MELADVLVAVAVGVALGLSLLVDIAVPWGGRLTMGLTLVMALPALITTRQLLIADAMAVVVIAIAGLLRRSSHQRHRTFLYLFRTVQVLAVVVGATWLLDKGTIGQPLLLTNVVVAAMAALAVRLVRQLLSGHKATSQLRWIVVVYLVLASNAALMAVAVQEVGVAMASVTALPLVITLFSFQRYAEATETLRQTVQALGLVPELAGLAPLGHSERAAIYAAAIAQELRFDGPDIDLVVTATRLHHLGGVQERDDASELSPTEVAAAGALVLRESGFPDDVADLLETARADGYGGESPTLAAAVVRVATAFDQEAGDDPANADRALALLSSVSLDTHGRRAAAALLSRVATHPTLVVDAIAAGARFRDAADGLDLEGLVNEGRGADLVPLAHHRS